LPPELLVAVLRSLAHLSDLFYSVCFWRELFLAVRALHSNHGPLLVDGHQAVRAYTNFLLLKCASVLDWSSDFAAEDAAIARLVELVFFLNVALQF
jgi:hypothetical protein